MSRRLTLGLCRAAALTCALAGCASTTPDYDLRFGEAVRHNRQAQVINPQPSQEAAVGVDAQTARAALQRYRESFRAPPPVVNVINLGSSASQAP